VAGSGWVVVSPRRRFGWAEYQATTQKFELWFDEIAIDRERIGCVL
jgi:hypothetical protein